MSERDGEISFRDFVVSNTHQRSKSESIQLDATVPLNQATEVVETEIPKEVEHAPEPVFHGRKMEEKSQHTDFSSNLDANDFKRIKPFHSTTSSARFGLLGIPLGIAIISFAFSFPMFFANTPLTQQEYDNIMQFQGHMVVLGPLLVIASVRSLTRGCKFYLSPKGVLVRPYKLGFFKLSPVTGANPRLMAFAKNRKNKMFSLVLWTGSEAFTLITNGNKKLVENFHAKTEDSATIELKWIDFEPDWKSKLERLATIIIIIFVAALILFTIAIMTAYQNGDISHEQLTAIFGGGEDDTEVVDEEPVEEGAFPPWVTDNMALIAILLFVIPIGFKLFVALRKMVKEPEVMRDRCQEVMSNR